jgi:hypothetical protein
MRTAAALRHLAVHTRLRYLKNIGLIMLPQPF